MAKAKKKVVRKKPEPPPVEKEKLCPIRLDLVKRLIANKPTPIPSKKRYFAYHVVTLADELVDALERLENGTLEDPEQGDTWSAVKTDEVDDDDIGEELF
jgi:hypothetical protein